MSAVRPCPCSSTAMTCRNSARAGTISPMRSLVTELILKTRRRAHEPGIPLVRDHLPLLEYGQDVARGVLEPRDVRTAAAENALLVHVKAVVPLETHSALG